MEDRKNFLSRFPLVTLPKGYGHVFETVQVLGVKDTLAGRSSRTSPLRANSVYYLDEQYGLGPLAESAFALTLIDLPILTMSQRDLVGDTLYFCGVVDSSMRQLRVIVYAGIKMYPRDDIFGVVTSRQEVEVFVSLPSSIRACMNSNNFCFVSYSHDMGIVKASAPIRVTQWRSPDVPNAKKRKTQKHERPEEPIDAVYLRLMATITHLKHDALFLRRLDEFVKRDAVKNAKIEEDTFICSDSVPTSTNSNNDDSPVTVATTADRVPVLVSLPVHANVPLPDDLPPLFADDDFE